MRSGRISRSRPASERGAPARSELAASWSRLHQGLDPDASPLLSAWLRPIWALARPLSRVPVGPNAITVAGVGFGIGAAALAKAAPRSAFGLLFAAAVADGLDGAVAILRDEVSDTGARLDRLADRVVEAAAAVALWRCGARPALVVAATASTFALEALRAADVGSSRRTITVAERPTRLICGGLGVLSRRSVAPAWTATGCAVVWLASGGIGIVQAVLAGPDPVLRSSGESEPERS